MPLLMWNIWKTINYHLNKHIKITEAKLLQFFPCAHTFEQIERLRGKLRVSKIATTAEWFDQNCQLIMPLYNTTLCYHHDFVSIGLHTGLFSLNHTSSMYAVRWPLKFINWAMLHDNNPSDRIRSNPFYFISNAFYDVMVVVLWMCDIQRKLLCR